MLDERAGEFSFDVVIGDAYAAVCDAWAAGAAPPERLTVSDYADAKRVIGEGAGAEPGRWRTSRNPPQREIMDCLSDHSPISIVTWKKSAQIGATEVGINFISYVIDRGIDSAIVSQPTRELAAAWSEGKFEPGISAMEDLHAKIGGEPALKKRFPGGTLWVIWANSSNQLRQRTARFLFLDEVDEYPRDLGEQGRAIDQVEARAMSYGKRAKKYRACTPTIQGNSTICECHEEGDQRVYMVPCPECGQHQDLHEDRVQPDGTFACAVNGCVIEEHHKTDMLRERSRCAVCGDYPARVAIGKRRDGRLHIVEECRCGRVEDPPPPDGAYWEPTAVAADPLHRSYYLWAAYSPVGLGPTWAEIAVRKAEAEADIERRAAFVNLILGKAYEGARQEQRADEVKTLAEPGVHLGTVPDGAYILTAGIDCQHDRFHVHVIGHGRGQRARVVDYFVVDGDPSRPDGYTDLKETLARTWANLRGRELHLAAVAIDGGNWTENVAQFVKGLVGTSGQSRVITVQGDHRKQSIYLVRGRSEKKSDRAVYRPRKTEVNERNKTLARSVGVWGVGTSVVKHIINGWITSAIGKRDEAEKAGEPDDIEARMLRFPGGRGEEYDPLHPDPGMLRPDYYEELTAHYFDITLGTWVKRKGVRDEVLDTLIYALWASLSPAIKIDAIREPQWAALAAKFEPAVDLFNPAQPSSPAAASVSREPTAPVKWAKTGMQDRGLASDAWNSRL